MGKYLKIIVCMNLITCLVILCQYYFTQQTALSAPAPDTSPTFQRDVSRHLSASVTKHMTINLVNITSDPLDSPNLQPPTQEWISSQFDKTMSLLKWIYTAPNQWEKCSGRTYYFPKINTIFTGVPKTGCSNWLLALVRAEGEVTKQIPPENVANFIHGRVTGIHRIPNLVDQYNSSDFRKAFSFTVVRNPWTRMVSGFRDKLSGERKNDPYRSIGKEIIRKIRGVKDPGLLQELYPTFPEYAEWLVEHGCHRDRHFNPQINELCIAHAVYDYIVPLEYTDILGREVWSKIGVQDSDLLGSYDKSSDPRYQKSTQYAKEWLSELDTDLIDQLYRTFRADFTLANYSNFTHPDFPLPLHGSN